RARASLGRGGAGPGTARQLRLAALRPRAGRLVPGRRERVGGRGPRRQRLGMYFNPVRAVPGVRAYGVLQAVLVGLLRRNALRDEGRLARHRLDARPAQLPKLVLRRLSVRIRRFPPRLRLSARASAEQCRLLSHETEGRQRAPWYLVCKSFTKESSSTSLEACRLGSSFVESAPQPLAAAGPGRARDDLHREPAVRLDPFRQPARQGVRVDEDGDPVGVLLLRPARDVD